MAVNIRRISSMTLLVVVLISIAVFGIFYFGGQMAVILVQDITNPKYTDELLFWIYILLAICIISMLTFGITQFLNKLLTHPKSSLVSFAVIVGFGLLLFLTYTLADATPFPMSSINPDTQQFNVEFWLRIIDMWIYSVYILIGLAVAVIVWGSVKKSFGK